MTIHHDAESPCSLTNVNSRDEELTEAVTALRQTRRGRQREMRRSARAPEPLAEHPDAHPTESLLDETADAPLPSDRAVHSPNDSGAELMATEPSAAPDPVAPSSHNDDSGSLDGVDPIDPGELVPILEALVFVSHDPLTLDRAVIALGVSKADVTRCFRQLQEQYDRDGRGLQVVELAGGFRIVTRPEYAPWLKRLEKTRPAPKLSRSAVESLAIIAYRQPVVRAEIEQIRGVETSGVLRTLLERKLVRMVGRKEVPGRPIMYGTTKYFLEHFGLKDLSELPPLRELKELGDSEQALLPVDDELLPVNHGDAVTDPIIATESP